ncbi:unnamed protein product [Vitrella brassicaformis CCMP3155]|uniref:Uncharacterized protein n=1 Tax=Vitrella brassicaformis (strain CCMP3155) TaxID=1169540 RepID=A0A0G4EHU4_VITBC|nr:unnamed protein product [Vitrella brassicaformis CCMP3155]|eukprot:CEL95560.1 unnamed protein product [Vitrella brassicaformis CCMP3155]
MASLATGHIGRRSRCLTYLVRREFKQRSKRLREQMMSPSGGGSTIHPLLQEVLSDLTALDDLISTLFRFFKLATQHPTPVASVDTPSPCYSPPQTTTTTPTKAARPSQGWASTRTSAGQPPPAAAAAAEAGAHVGWPAGELTGSEMPPQIDPRVTGYLLSVTCGHNGVSQ